MAINGIGGMSSADLIAYLALQTDQADKKTHDAMRRTEEDVQSEEDAKEISSMEDKAVWTMVSGLGSAALQAGEACASFAERKSSQDTKDITKEGFGAATSAWGGVANAMVGFADKDATQHKVLADRAQQEADDCNSASKQAQDAGNQALEIARSIRQTEDETLLLAAKRG